MRHESARTRRTWAFALAAALLPGASAAHAYTLVTKDGHVIESTQKPDVKGAQVFLRLPPHGRLAVVQESQIDWQRTQAANPAPQRLVVPTNAQMVRKERPADGNIEKKIVGDGTHRAGPVSKEEPGAPGQAGKPAVAQAPQSQQSVHDQEALVSLRKQHVEVTTLLTNVRAQLESHEKELAELQSRQSAFVSDDNPAQTRIRELQDEISSERARVSQLENRLADIRAEAVQHGGSID